MSERCYSVTGDSYKIVIIEYFKDFQNTVTRETLI